MLAQSFVSRKILYPLIALFVWSGLLAQNVSAGIITTESLLTDLNAEQLQSRLSKVLERDDVLERLQAYGVSPADAADRVAALSEHEVQQLAQHFDELPAGGDVTLLLVVIILVLLLR